MLVLSRKKNEQIQIGEDVRIVVIEIRGDKVRLGIDAPTTIPVHRSEIYEAKLRNNEPLIKRPNEPVNKPEINYDEIDALRGMDIVITTSARTPEEGRALLEAFNFPFKK